MKTAFSAVAALMIACSPLAAQSPSPAAINFASQQNQTEVLGTDFIGTPVVTPDGQKIGSIANLVFDQNGRIELAVIGVGGFLGVGQKEVALPFDSIKSDVQKDKHVFVIEANKDQLKAAPSYQTLDQKAFKQRMADWRAKASESWAEVKKRASKAYEEAKTKIDEARQPSDSK
jgi:sporulation protein YlmC with PRC-barrel domain